VLIVPANAVFTEGKNSYVGVSNGKSCNDIPVTVGTISDTVIEITGGFLKEGDEVCVPSIDNRILDAMGMNTSEPYGSFPPAQTGNDEGLLIK
jgi:hypothetical protein